MERVPLLEFEAILVLILLVSNHTFFDKNHCCLANFQKVESRSLSLSLSNLMIHSIQGQMQEIRLGSGWNEIRFHLRDFIRARFASIRVIIRILVGGEGNARNALYEWKERKKEEERFGSISL